MLRWFVLASTLGTAAACSLGLDGFTGGASTSDAGTTVTLPDGGAVPSTTPSDASAVDAGSTSASCTLPAGADVTQDAHNCGACGHDCLGGLCLSGKCQVNVLSSSFDHPLGCSVNGGKIYVSDAQGIDELDLDGSNQHTVVTASGANYVLATDTDVYFTDGGSIQRWSRSARGPSVQVLVGLNNPQDMAIAGGLLYFTQYLDPNAGGGLFSVTFPDFGSKQLVLKYNHPEGVDWQAGELFLGSDGVDSVISIDPSAAQHTLTTGGGPVDMSVLGTDLYVSRQAAGQIIHLPAGGGITDVVASGLANPSGIVATPTALYWVENSGSKLSVLAR